MLTLLGFFWCVSADFFAANNSKISYLGRFSYAQSPASATFAWSGSTIQFSFIGTNASIQFQSTYGQYDILIDGKISSLFKPSASAPTFFPLATNLVRGPHVLTLRKRTEGQGQAAKFFGVLIDGELTTPPPKSFRRFEAVGDSITCGYGNLGAFGCSFSLDTEDYFSTYTYQTATFFGADINVVAWSGKGVVRNYGSTSTTSPDPVPSFYPYPTNAMQGEEWNFSSYLPDLVMINLGTNDFSTNPAPSSLEFQTGYTNFVKLIRLKYPQNPYVALLCGPMINNPCCSYVQSVVNAQKAGGDTKIFYVDMQVGLQNPADLGCDYHPNVQANSKMAARLISVISNVTGWNGPPDREFPTDTNTTKQLSSAAQLSFSFVLLAIFGFL